MSRSKCPAREQSGAKTELEKGLVMGTNGSSIVSKRSVEQLYFPEPHFIRYFVKKRQRRSPLINRGYWLRMYAIEHTVKTFLQEYSDRPKIILNLGCGFDPLPFQFLTRAPEFCRHVRFIDIDYHKLMLEKRDAIRNTSALNSLLSNTDYPAEDSPTLIRSKEYIGIGCDLGELAKLEAALRSELGSIAKYSILCTAEVSLTYMDVKSADALLQWASTLSNDSQFCLLEQYFPDGPDHPFAKTMMNHFQKLRTPLYSIHEYPSMRQQEQRFLSVGWAHAKANNLWVLWSDSQFLSEKQRTSLDSFEAFDEWEEFALFASHYFLLIASTKRSDANADSKEPLDVNGSNIGLSLVSQCPPRFNAQRRFGAIVPVEKNLAGVHGGLGLQTRLPSTQVYSDTEARHSIHDLPPTTMLARMCHSSVLLNNGSLISGGRASPTAAFGDCWLKSGEKWSQVDSLPTACFRHSTTTVNVDGQRVLLFGGKSGTGNVLGQFLLWSEGEGWSELPVMGSTPQPRFGASLISIDGHSGILCGGMSQGGVVLNDFWTWRLVTDNSPGMKLMLMDVSVPLSAATPLYPWLGRFGSTVNLLRDYIVFIGGISQSGCIPEKYEVLLLDVKCLRQQAETSTHDTSILLLSAGVGIDTNGPRPLLAGHSTFPVPSEKILIAGGGAVCFSFGTYWNSGTWLLQDTTLSSSNGWLPVESAIDSEQNPARTITATPQPSREGSVVQVARMTISSSQEFRTIVDKGLPVILQGLDFGRCVELWTKEYLQKAVGGDRKVVVHECGTDHMDFRAKNFSYVTKEFGTFLDEVDRGGRQYLRAISADKPTEQAANLAIDFPGLNDDFRIPAELSLVSENAHSSPLRISGPVILWLHYDVLANVLCQIRGTKKLILFPPRDVSKLGFAPGASSSSINVFQDGFPHGTTPHEAPLKPGDVLFLPPLWLHTACPTDGVSVAVNVFFRSLAASSYSPGRDVYGNRDLHAYEKGRRDVEKIWRSFDRLPCDIARFYLDRLADELREKAAT
ncbi:tRNA methyltransferase ppm2 [Ophidiomyces ophidiicola]|nr:tRNA methyltransferase ppm2 [Ophidiomyces ophidiicola]KAI1984323.1 tRNA methyltransferase ppm2 [Ophidiomyces ophidiicola]KAI1996029.1 tRNA methyltransferase ppm2 [Ophidiomyces ophidiicola]KAI1996242.1 tRNA methyltransferase ppm2 [Ophidiomyces ophidiicola]